MKMEFDELSNRVIGCAIEVHQHLRPGMNFNMTKLKDGIKRFVL